MKNTTLFSLLLCAVMGLYFGCKSKEVVPVCDVLLSDLTLSTLPEVTNFEVIASDTAAHSVTVRYTSPSLQNVCPNLDASMLVRATGSYTNAKASLWWSANDKTDFNLTQQAAVWTGTSQQVDISNVYDNVAGRLWVTLDLTFPYAGTDTSITAVYQELGNVFQEFYFKPDAFKFIP